MPSKMWDLCSHKTLPNIHLSPDTANPDKSTVPLDRMRSFHQPQTKQDCFEEFVSQVGIQLSCKSDSSLVPQQVSKSNQAVPGFMHIAHFCRAHQYFVESLKPQVPTGSCVPTSENPTSEAGNTALGFKGCPVKKILLILQGAAKIPDNPTHGIVFNHIKF